ncbi:hypothetical protein TI03_00225 [Achromatium sp. WMS1]|nr:hypothetical protein TI03_00225 [Achromatium sp. WMS1]
MYAKLSRLYAEIIGISLLMCGYIGGVMGAVQVENPYARIIPGQPNGAVFMTLHNNNVKEQTLVAAKSSIAQAVELHTHTMDGGMMRMRRIDKIKIPKNSKVTLQPGGLHIMLIGLRHDQITIGESFSLTLTYQDGTQQTLQVPIPDMATHHHTHMMHREHMQ